MSCPLTGPTSIGGAEVDAKNGPGSHLSPSQHQLTGSTPLHLSLPIARAGDQPAQSGLEHGHYLRADVPGLYVSGSRDGLV